MGADHAYLWIDKDFHDPEVAKKLSRIQMQTPSVEWCLKTRSSIFQIFVHGAARSGLVRNFLLTRLSR